MKLSVLRQLFMISKYCVYGLIIQCIVGTSLLASREASAQKQSIEKINISIEKRTKKLADILNQISESTDFEFALNSKKINLEKNIELDQYTGSLGTILREISDKAEIGFRRVNNNIFIRNISKKGERDHSFAVEEMLEVDISGKVTDENGQGLPGATVVVKGLSTGTTSDLDGNYKMTAPDDGIIVVSYVGYVTQEVQVGARSEINIQMTPDAQQLSEIVVTAFGIEREKKALGYSVQEVSGDELVEAREINVANSLKGKVAGVFVNSSSGGPGGSSFVQIRGSSSLGGDNQPLYVVDGIPISNDNLNQTNIFAGRDFGDGIKDINPDDIESISVLKGPSAAALYGSRGANGVILITTKKSSKKGIGVSFNSNATFETINVIPKFQNTYGPTYDDDDRSFESTTIDGQTYDQIPSWAIDNWGPKFDDRLVVYPLLRDLGPVPYSAQPQDNIRNFYNTGSTFTNTISVSGGADKVSYRVSASNMDNKGIIPNSEFKRRTFSARFGADVTDRLHIEAKANFINSIGVNRPIAGVSSGTNVAGSINLIPQNINLDWLKEYKNPDGSHRNWRASPTNPYWIINEMPSEDSRDRLIGLMSANYKLTDWLNVQARVGSDSYTESQRQQYNQGTPGGSYVNGRVDFNQYRVNELNTDVLVTASGSLSEDFKGTLSVGSNRYTRSWEKVATVGQNMDIPGLYTIENAKLVIPSYDIIKKEIQSVYMTGQLAYKNYIFLDVTARNDWSSTLSNYSFIYPSASLSYAITDALKVDSELLTFAKLRLSYAQAGNDADPYKTKGGYNVQSQFFQGQRFASIQGSVPPVNLKNELSSSFEVGTDVRLFNNRVSIDFTYYSSKTSNQILNVGLSEASGYGSLFLNAGEVSNKGIELFVSATPIKSTNSLTWGIDVNFSKNNSKVESLVDGIDRYNFISTGNASIVAIPGLPYGTIYGYKYKRSPDGELVVHESGDYYVREDDQSVLGDVQPDWLAGVTNTLSFKGISLSALLDIRMGGEIYSWSRVDQNAKGTGVWTNNRDNLVVEGVIDNNDGTYTPTSKTVLSQNRFAQLSWGNIGEEFVLDATYVSLREVTLGYSLSKSILSKTPFNSAKFSVVGRNLLYLYRDAKFEEMGIAPESAFAPTAAAQGYEAFSMPTTRSLGFNLSLTF
ncbi:SusC/RagA family TonB-linked outer membrane protein [Reichenbachiella sp. MALMAid0571]|uniref:SusC/RagA family TonB-linked outer membrane protein n=1 Tax=Reichenbachiella sp. MALMAid0571 TaxID=3143939 RepID=UPI0032DEF7F5